MNLDLTGKRALVCGSTQGIGRAAAIELALLGASITLLARDEAKLGKVVAELPAPKKQKHGTLRADFAKPDEVRQVVQAALDPAAPYSILINNSGGPPP